MPPSLASAPCLHNSAPSASSPSQLYVQITSLASASSPSQVPLPSPSPCKSQESLFHLIPIHTLYQPGPWSLSPAYSLFLTSLTLLLSLYPLEPGPLPQVVPFPHIMHPAPADKPIPHQKPLTCLCFQASQALFSAGLSLSVYTCLPSYLCPLPWPRLPPQPGSLPLLGRLPLYPPRPSPQRSHIPSQYPLLQ